jgi:actin-like ATPase involved in cell morphogenesis
MDSSKLLKAIQILIKEELKEQLPTLIKESVKAEVKRILTEQVKPSQQKKESTGLSMAKAILGETPKKIAPKMEEVKYVKDDVLNQILNETRQQYAGTPSNNMDRTLNFSNPNIAGAGLEGLRAEMAAKMGYSDMGNGGAQPGGLGVQTGHADLDKALNRDYSELVKRFNKKK